MSRLLALVPAPSVAASTRFRVEQFGPALAAAGIELSVRPFLDEEGFRVLYAQGGAITKLRTAATAVAGRLGDLVRAQRADVVLVHREAALVGPPILEWAIARALGRPVIFDLDDAIWVPYVSPTYGALLSRLLKSPAKTHFTLGAAAAVICGNRYLSDYAQRYNARVDIIPTVVDTDIFRPAAHHNAVPVLGWIGTHSTVQYLRAILPALRRLATQRRFVLCVVGAELDAAEMVGLDVDHRRWSLDREVADFQSLDLGLYPLVEDAWSVGKSGFKAIQYMAAGVPVVASPVGVTTEIISDGRTGFLAADEDTWVRRLTELIDSEPTRRRLANAGRAEVVARWSLAAHAPRFVDLVRSVLTGSQASNSQASSSQAASSQASNSIIEGKT